MRQVMVFVAAGMMIFGESGCGKEEAALAPPARTRTPRPRQPRPVVSRPSETAPATAPTTAPAGTATVPATGPMTLAEFLTANKPATMEQSFAA